MEDSVSYWIENLKQGDASAASRLWETYFQRLTGFARARLGHIPRRMADEEDVALSVFDSLGRGATQGRYPNLTDRENLWSLLVVITSRKVCDYIAAEHTQKRGGGQVVAASQLASAAERDTNVLDAVLSREPTPEMAATFAEECERLLGMLDPDHRCLALGKMDGHSNEELATTMSCGVRTVERRLELIRRIWKAAEC